MVAVPGPEIPLTIPVDAPIVATAVLLLLHVPPATVLLSVILDPTHTADVPVIAAGIAYTVTVAYATQPAAMV